jgi:excisionase family DNA binding protein
MTTQVFFSGYGRWYLWGWDDETDTGVIHWATDSISNSGIFSLTPIDDLRLKHTKEIHELDIQRLDLSDNEEDCAFLRSSASKKYFRDLMEFSVDTTKPYILEVVREKSDPVKKDKKVSTFTVDPEKIENKTFISIQEASVITGLSQGYIYKLTSKQKIPHYKPGGKKLYFKVDELRNWIQQHPVKTFDDIERDANKYIGI